MVGLIRFILFFFVFLSYGQEHILIGDSQTTYLSKNSIKIKRIPELSKGGIGVPYLINMVSSYPKSTNVKSVSICIGVNDRYKDRGVNELVKIVKNKFPNAKLFVIQGSWGWGGVSKMNQTNLDLYYKHFVDLGCSLITPPIGYGDPHRDKKTYETIIKKIESLINKNNE
jgi:hypothetical protein